MKLIELHPNSMNKENGLDLKEAMQTFHSLPQSTTDLTKVIKMLTALFRTKSCVLLLHMPPLPLLTICAISLTLGSPSRYLMIPRTLTPLSYSLSPFTCTQFWSFSGQIYYIIFIKFIITPTNTQLCLI